MAISITIIKQMLNKVGIKKFLDGHPTETEFYTKWYWMYASVGQVAKDVKFANYNINGTNADGDTPLMLAIKCKRNIMVLNTLIAFGADVHAKNNAGQTAQDVMNNTYKWLKKDLYYGDYDIVKTIADKTA